MARSLHLALGAILLLAASETVLSFTLTNSDRKVDARLLAIVSSISLSLNGHLRPPADLR
jgi:hypothetical protein